MAWKQSRQSDAFCNGEAVALSRRMAKHNVPRMTDLRRLTHQSSILKTRLF